MTKEVMERLAVGMADATKKHVQQQLTPLQHRIEELEAQKQLAAARIAALEQATTLLETETKMLRLDLETRAHPGWDSAKKVYRGLS